MRRLLGSERGDVSITQLLVALSIFAGVLGATVSLFEHFVVQDRKLNARNDSQDVARAGLDRLARTLRNLASPTPAQPDAFDRAGANDMIFKTVDTNGPNSGSNTVNVERIRYCLDTSTASNHKLVMQVQTWTTAAAPTAPSATGCPGSGWTGNAVTLVEHVSNYADGLSRPIFTYDASTLQDITQIHSDLRVDTDTSHDPPETTLSTGVFLRNQNRRPTASFTWSTNTEGIVLNGSASSDPEGEPLKYEWWDPAAADPTTPVGTGITFTYPVTHGSTHTITLKVFDPAGLEADATTTGVTG